MTTQELTLPWPPSVNTIWRHIAIGGKPRTIISKRGREYYDAVAAEVAVHGLAPYGFGDRLAVEVYAFPPYGRHRDLDNILKATLDSLTKSSVWPDDSQIDRLMVVRRPSVKRGRVHLVISKIKESQA